MTYLSKQSYEDVKDRLIQVTPDEIPLSYWNDLDELCGQIFRMPFNAESLYAMQNAIGDMTEEYIRDNKIHFNLYFMISADFEKGIIDIKAQRVNDDHS